MTWFWYLQNTRRGKPAPTRHRFYWNKRWWRWIYRRGRGVTSYYSCEQFLHSNFSNAELYINIHEIHNSNGLYARNSQSSYSFRSTLLEYNEVLHCERYDYEKHPENVLEGQFITKRMKFYSRPDGFMLYGKLSIDFLQHWKYYIQIWNYESE